jgi:glutathione S-transferase
MENKELTLYIDASWNSPWAFHALVALEEKRLPYRIVELDLDAKATRTPEFLKHSVTGKIPVLQYGSHWIAESLAISEYLAEKFPFPDHPRIFPADLGERARARQIMSFVRTDLYALREERPTQRMFGHHEHQPLSDAARRDADELVRVAELMLSGSDGTTLFTDWSIADADLVFCLQRLGLARHPLSGTIQRYIDANWARPSIAAFVEHPR